MQPDARRKLSGMGSGASALRRLSAGVTLISERFGTAKPGDSQADRNALLLAIGINPVAPRSNTALSPVNLAEMHRLIEEGVKVDGCRDRHGSTALGVAASLGRCEAMQVLLEAGADVEAVNLDDASPLSLAVFGRSAAAVAMLLVYGGDSLDYSEALSDARATGAKAVISVFDAWEDDDSHPLIDAAHAMYAQSEPILKERVAAVASAAAVAAASDPNGVNEWRERTEAAEQKATTAEQQLQEATERNSEMEGALKVAENRASEAEDELRTVRSQLRNANEASSAFEARALAAEAAVTLARAGISIPGESSKTPRDAIKRKGSAGVQATPRSQKGSLLDGVWKRAAASALVDSVARVPSPSPTLSPGNGERPERSPLGGTSSGSPAGSKVRLPLAMLASLLRGGRSQSESQSDQIDKLPDRRPSSSVTGTSASRTSAPPAIGNVPTEAVRESNRRSSEDVSALRESFRNRAASEEDEVVHRSSEAPRRESLEGRSPRLSILMAENISTEMVSA